MTVLNKSMKDDYTVRRSTRNQKKKMLRKNNKQIGRKTKNF